MQSCFSTLQAETSTTLSIALSMLLDILATGWTVPFPSLCAHPWEMAGWVSFTSLTVATSTLDWISGWMYHSLWWNLHFFLADWCGRASCVCHTEEIFFLLSQTSSSLAHGENLWIGATPLLHQKLPRLSSVAPRSTHAPVTRWDLHSPPPSSQASWGCLILPRNELRSHQLTKPPFQQQCGNLLHLPTPRSPCSFQRTLPIDVTTSCCFKLLNFLQGNLVVILLQARGKNKKAMQAWYSYSVFYSSHPLGQPSCQPTMENPGFDHLYYMEPSKLSITFLQTL